MQVPHNDLAPHRTVLWVEAQVHEVLATGECSGRPVRKVERFPLFFDASDRFAAEKQLNELLASWKQEFK